MAAIVREARIKNRDGTSCNTIFPDAGTSTPTGGISCNYDRRKQQKISDNDGAPNYDCRNHSMAVSFFETKWIIICLLARSDVLPSSQSDRQSHD
jgi:hypothetical protein